MANTNPILEDDLLIVPDGNSKDDNTLFFLDNESPKKDNSDLFLFNTDSNTNNLTVEHKEDNTITENSIFDFWAPNWLKVETDSDLLVENDKKELSNDDLIDFWLVVDNKKEELTDINVDTLPIVESQVLPNVKPEFIENKIIEEVNIEDNDDLNHIIESTIKKLDLRKWKIWDKKNKNLTKIEDLRLHIETLEKEKISFEEQNMKLDEESKKIDLNVKQLEKMKIFETGEENKEVNTKKH